MKRLQFGDAPSPPVTLRYETDEMARVREHISKTAQWDDAFIDQMIKGYNVICCARRQLGIQPGSPD